MNVENEKEKEVEMGAEVYQPQRIPVEFEYR